MCLNAAKKNIKNLINTKMKKLIFVFIIALFSVTGFSQNKKAKKTNLYKAAGCPLHNRPTHLRFKVMKNIQCLKKCPQSYFAMSVFSKILKIL